MARKLTVELKALVSQQFALNGEFYNTTARQSISEGMGQCSLLTKGTMSSQAGNPSHQRQPYTTKAGRCYFPGRLATQTVFSGLLEGQERNMSDCIKVLYILTIKSRRGILYNDEEKSYDQPRSRTRMRRKETKENKISKQRTVRKAG